MERILDRKRFGSLLTTAVKRIALHEDKNIALIQDELGYSLRKKNGDRYGGGAIIEHWRRGNLPPDLAITLELTKTLAGKKGLEPEECEAFLDHAGHPNPAMACQEFFSHSMNGKQKLSTSDSATKLQVGKKEEVGSSVTINIAFNRHAVTIMILALLVAMLAGFYVWRGVLAGFAAATGNPILLEAAYVTEGPEINGRLDDPIWTQANPILFAEHPPKNDETTVVVKLLWDEEYLYVGVDVNDTQVEGAGSTPWDGDSFSLILENGGQAREYRHSLINETEGDKAGDSMSAHLLKEGTTFNEPSDEDEGYTIEMQIPIVEAPTADDIIYVDLLSVDHDYNPGQPYNSSRTIFSKIFWDADETVEESGGFLRFGE